MASQESFTGKIEAVALFDYNKQEDDELTIEVGQVIKDVIQVDDSGWYTGELNGARGLFPSNYVEIRSATAQDIEYSFISDLPEDYTCQICMKLLNEPQLTDCCGQHFCRSCLDQWFQQEGKKHCPHCRSENFTHILNKPLKRKINELKVYCSNRERGCGLTVKLVELERHLSTGNPNGCGYVVVKCPNKCCQSILRKDKEHHCKNTCPEREVTCIYCKNVGPHSYISSTDLEGHVEHCQEYPVDCPNKCEVKGLKRKDIEKHTQEVCPLEPVRCMFSEVGCKEKLVRKDLAAHIQSSNQQHLLNIMVSHAELKKQHNEHKKVRNELENKHNELEKKHDELEKKFNVLEKKHNVLEKKYNELEENHTELQMENQNHRSIMVKIASKLEHIQASVGNDTVATSLEEIKTTLNQALQMTKESDQLIFRIPHGSSDWVSPTFKVNDKKMYLKVEPPQLDIYPEENASLSIILVSGDLDELHEIQVEGECEGRVSTLMYINLCRRCHHWESKDQEIKRVILPGCFEDGSYYKSCKITLTLYDHIYCESYED